jgi:hypothetical protein
MKNITPQSVALGALTGGLLAFMIGPTAFLMIGAILCGVIVLDLVHK